jgi:hypothetical protein
MYLAEIAQSRKGPPEGSRTALNRRLVGVVVEDAPLSAKTARRRVKCGERDADFRFDGLHENRAPAAILSAAPVELAGRGPRVAALAYTG